MKRMSMVVATTIAAGLLSAGTASAADWTMSFLPLPPGSGEARVTTTDGDGSYAGQFERGSQGLITWTDGTFANHGVPAGYDTVSAVDENKSRSVLGNATSYAERRYRSFTLDGGEFRFLATPSGYANSTVVGMNNRGDIVGDVFNDPRFGSTAAFWPAADRAHPVLLDVPPLLHPVDIDHDGTILLNEQFGGTHLWKDGLLRQLVLPEGITESRGIAIRDGRVLAATSLGDRLWTAFDTSTPVPGNMRTTDISGSGLVSGSVPPSDRPGSIPAAWSPDDPVSTLPAPTEGFGAVAGDNGEIAGVLQGGGYDGRPVVWRRG